MSGKHGNVELFQLKPVLSIVHEEDDPVDTRASEFTHAVEIQQPSYQIVTLLVDSMLMLLRFVGCVSDYIEDHREKVNKPEWPDDIGQEKFLCKPGIIRQWSWPQDHNISLTCLAVEERGWMAFGVTTYRDIALIPLKKILFPGLVKMCSASKRSIPSMANFVRQSDVGEQTETEMFDMSEPTFIEIINVHKKPHFGSVTCGMWWRTSGRLHCAILGTSTGYVAIVNLMSKSLVLSFHVTGALKVSGERRHIVKLSLQKSRGSILSLIVSTQCDNHYAVVLEQIDPEMRCIRDITQFAIGFEESEKKEGRGSPVPASSLCSWKSWGPRLIPYLSKSKVSVVDTNKGNLLLSLVNNGTQIDIFDSVTSSNRLFQHSLGNAAEAVHMTENVFITCHTPTHSTSIQKIRIMSRLQTGLSTAHSSWLMDFRQVSGILQEITVPHRQIFRGFLRSPSSDIFKTLPYEGVMAWTNTTLFEVRLIEDPRIVFFSLIEKGLYEDALEIGKTFSLDLVDCYEEAADKYFMNHDYNKAFHIYSLSGVNPEKLAQKYIEANRIAEGIQYLSSLVYFPGSSTVTLPQRGPLADILFDMYLRSVTETFAPPPIVDEEIVSPRGHPASLIELESVPCQEDSGEEPQCTGEATPLFAQLGKRASRQAEQEGIQLSKSFQQILYSGRHGVSEGFSVRTGESDTNSVAYREATYESPAFTAVLDSCTAIDYTPSASDEVKKKSKAETTIPFLSKLSRTALESRALTSDTECGDLQYFLEHVQTYSPQPALVQLSSRGLYYLALHICVSRNMTREGLKLMIHNGLAYLTAKCLDFLLRSGNAPSLLSAATGVLWRTLGPEDRVRSLVSLLRFEKVVPDKPHETDSRVLRSSHALMSCVVGELKSCKKQAVVKEVLDFFTPTSLVEPPVKETICKTQVVYHRSAFPVWVSRYGEQDQATGHCLMVHLFTAVKYLHLLSNGNIRRLAEESHIREGLLRVLGDLQHCSKSRDVKIYCGLAQLRMVRSFAEILGLHVASAYIEKMAARHDGEIESWSLAALRNPELVCLASGNSDTLWSEVFLADDKIAPSLLVCHACAALTLSRPESDSILILQKVALLLPQRLSKSEMSMAVSFWGVQTKTAIASALYQLVRSEQ